VAVSQDTKFVDQILGGDIAPKGITGENAPQIIIKTLNMGRLFVEKCPEPGQFGSFGPLKWLFVYFIGAE
jgi:hypothetical protein